jgi:hypothetical protein
MLTLTDKIELINFIKHFARVNGPVLIHTAIEATAGVKLLMIKADAVAPSLPFQPDVNLASLPGEALQHLANYVRDICRGAYRKQFKGRTFYAV